MPLRIEEKIEAKTEKPKLRRSLGLFEVTIYGIGIILGAGIYALIGEGAGLAGNSLWLSFVIGAIIASLTGLSYAELSNIIPKSAAEYEYVHKATKSKFLAFLIGWIIVFTGIVAGATVALGFGGYFSSMLGGSVVLAAIGLIIVMTFINWVGIKESAKANIIFTAVELLGLLLIIFLGLPHLGTVDYFEMPTGMAGVFGAAILMFFAYIGFEDIVNVAEETKNAKKVLPKALIIALIVTTLLYILVAVSAVSILDWQILGASSAPLADVAESAYPGSSIYMSIIALFATANTVLVLLIVDSRMLWGMARSGSFPKIFSKIGKRSTPTNSIIVIGLITLLMTTLGDIKSIAEITNIGAFLIFFSVNLSLILLRYRMKKPVKGFKVPFNIGKFPVLAGLGVIFCLFMLTQFEWNVIMMTLGVLGVGAITYILLNYNKW